MDKATSPSVGDAQAAAKKKEADKKKATASRQWMYLNGKGECMVVEVEKHVLMHRFHIHGRDLRILDPLLFYPSAIFGRERAIVLNLEHVKAIITAKEVLLRNPSNGNVIPIVEELCRRLPMKNDAVLASGDHAEVGGMEPPRLRRLSKSQQKAEDGPPFEFRALEVALEAVCSFLDARTTELEAAAYPALEALTLKVSSRKLDRVRKLKTTMTRLTARVQKVRDELDDLLDDNGDMAELFLTRKLACLPFPVDDNEPPSLSAGCSTLVSRFSGVSKASVGSYNAQDDDVEEVELILEAYFMQIDGTLNKLVTLREHIDHTEDYINFQLDKHRNRLIQLELVLNASTVVLAVFAAVAGIFGMNIPYPWMFGHDYIFKWVVFLTTIVCAIIFVAFIFYARSRGLIGT